MRLDASLFTIAAIAGAACGEIVINNDPAKFPWTNPFARSETPEGFRAKCEAVKSFPARQHLLHDMSVPLPLGLEPWSNAIKYFFGGRPYPGQWLGHDPDGADRQVMAMELTDVPDTVKNWIDEVQKYKESDECWLFAVYPKPSAEGEMVGGTTSPKPTGTADTDDNKIVMFAAGAIYRNLPLWVADGSECEDELRNIVLYSNFPVDGSVVAWVESTEPEEGSRDVTFTIKAQLLEKIEGTDEGKETTGADDEDASEAEPEPAHESVAEARDEL